MTATVKMLSMYRPIVANKSARDVLILGFLLRLPNMAFGIVITLHVVNYLHRSWAEAGVASLVVTLGLAISGPWRGMMLDSLGLRKATLPSIVIGLLAWGVVPWLDYHALLVCVGIAALMNFPIYPIIRQSLFAVVEKRRRNQAVSLDSVLAEVAYMTAPLAAVALIPVISTRYVLISLSVMYIGTAFIVWLVNPPLRAGESEEDPSGPGSSLTAASNAWGRFSQKFSWINGQFLLACIAGGAGGAIIMSTELAIIAALKDFQAEGWTGLVLAIWGFGSLLGGLLYGTFNNPPNISLVLLALLTVTAGFLLAANLPITMAIAFISGFPVASIMIASTNLIGEVVPEQVRGQAMGWQGTFIMGGGGLSAPITGMAIDSYGHIGGYIAAFSIGAFFAIAGYGAMWMVRYWRARSRKLAS